MWYLVLALFLIAIIEKDNIQDPASDGYFNLFTIIFELSSAYGTVGVRRRFCVTVLMGQLSLGSPVTGTSLSGQFKTLSKLVVRARSASSAADAQICAVMLRGRHVRASLQVRSLTPQRGLPIAIDRAVLLPADLSKMTGRSDLGSQDADARTIRTRRRASSVFPRVNTISARTRDVDDYADEAATRPPLPQPSETAPIRPRTSTGPTIAFDDPFAGRRARERSSSMSESRSRIDRVIDGRPPGSPVLAQTQLSTIQSQTVDS